MKTPDPQSPESRRLIYARTAAGEAEIEARSHPLSPSARRMLMLIDGRRTVGLLSQFARVGEFDALAAELLALELIETAGMAEPPDEAGRRARMAAERAALLGARQRLQGLFAAQLGVEGHVWDARVGDSVNMEVLRRVLREGVDVVSYRHGEGAANRILAAVRPVFEQLKCAAQ